MTNFTSLAKQARKEFITKVFYNNSSNSFFRPIPITKQEEVAQKSEANMTKVEITCKIEAFLEQMSKSVQKKYLGIKSKKRNELLIILEEVRSLFNSDNEHDDSDCFDNSET